MLFDAFKRITTQLLREYYQMISPRKLSSSSLRERIRYPQAISFAECHDGFAVELSGLGRTPSFSPTSFKPKSILQVFDSFSEQSSESMIEPLDVSLFRMDGFCLAREDCIAGLSELFPGYENRYNTRISFGDSPGPIFSLGDGFRSTMLERCLVCNSLNSVVRYKHILLAAVFSKSVHSDELRTFWETSLGFEEIRAGTPTTLHGVFICDASDEDLYIATQFRSMFMEPGFHETSIGQFLREPSRHHKVCF